MRVLLVKLSSLGDVIHAMPAVTDARAELGADCTIDWAVEEDYAELVGCHPAVARVIPIALRRWRKHPGRQALAELRSYLEDLRSCSYDAVVDAQGLLKSALLGARPALGPAHGFSASCARERLAALFYKGGRHNIAAGLHMITRIRRLFAIALGYVTPATAPDCGLASSFADAPKREAVVLLHSTAKRSKLLDESKWIAVGKLLAESGLQCELPWGSEAERLRAERIAAACGGSVIPKQSLRATAAHLAGAAGAIGLDTGLMHLAAALDVPCVGLFVASDPMRTGNAGPRQVCCGNAAGLAPADIVGRLAQLRAQRAAA